MFKRVCVWSFKVKIQKHRLLWKSFWNFKASDSSIHHTTSSGMCQTGPRVILQHVNEPKHSAIKNSPQKQGEQGALQQMVWSPQISHSPSQAWITRGDRRNWDSLNPLKNRCPLLIFTLLVLVHRRALLRSRYLYSVLIRSWFSFNLFHYKKSETFSVQFSISIQGTERTGHEADAPFRRRPYSSSMPGERVVRFYIEAVQETGRQKQLSSGAFGIGMVLWEWKYWQNDIPGLWFRFHRWQHHQCLGVHVQDEWKEGYAS